MRTDDPRNITPSQDNYVPAGPPPSTNEPRQNDAAANLVRSQISHIFQEDSTQPEQPQQTTTPAPAVSQTQTPNPAPQQQQQNSNPVPASSWEQYHSAWQDYYQQYYQRYYIGQPDTSVQPAAAIGSNASDTVAQTSDGSVGKNEALEEMRSKLRNNINDSAKKVRSSKHFYPIFAAFSVMIIFLFLQYNSVLIGTVKAYVSPGNINPTNIIVGTGADIPIGPESKLIIPKINVEVPVIFDTTPDHASQMKAMEGGVAWFGIPGANAKPGQVGNSVLSGHSSNDILEGGNYKFIFAKLDQLAEGDTFYINYESKRYTYSVTRKEVVKPSEVSKLVYPTEKPVMTLITCTPLGTSLNRLLVTAEQISPDPGEAPANEASDSVTQEPGKRAAMPGQGQTLFEKMFGGN